MRRLECRQRTNVWIHHVAYKFHGFFNKPPTLYRYWETIIYFKWQKQDMLSSFRPLAGWGLQRFGWKSLREYLSTHLFSHWSIPLNRGIFKDFFTVFFQLFALVQIFFAPVPRWAKYVFHGLRYCWLCSDVKKQSDIKIYYFFPFHFSNKPFYSTCSCTQHFFLSTNWCFFNALKLHWKVVQHQGWKLIRMRKNCRSVWEYLSRYFHVGDELFILFKAFHS